MSGILEAGGPMALMVLALGVLGAVVTLALGGAAFMKKRVPMVAWLFLPVVVCSVGAIGAWTSAGAVFDQIAAAEAESLNEVAMAGLWQSVTVDWFSRWIAAGLLVLGAWAAGLGSTVSPGPAEETRFTPVAASFVAITTVIGSVILAAVVVRYKLGFESFLLVGTLLIGGLGVAFASSRRALYEHAYRVAAMRFTSAVLAVLAVAWAGSAVQMGAQITMFGPNGQVHGLDLSAAAAAWTAFVDPLWALRWLALGIIALTAFYGFFSELGEIVQRYTLVDSWATLALMGGLLFVRTVESSRTDALSEVATHAPARAIYEAWGTDLPTAALMVEKQPIYASPLTGGYGDVLAYQNVVIGYNEEDGSPITTREWRRVWAWTGSTWDEDDSPLDCTGRADCTPITLNSTRLPLLAIPKGEDAANLMSAAKLVPNSEFMLLLRAPDVGDKIALPTLLAHGSLGFVGIQVGAPVDLTRELWVDAGYKELFWGPTHWYGEGEDKEPVLYSDAVYASAALPDGTLANPPGVHVVVSQRARVEGVAASCLASAVTFADGATTPSGHWCSLVEGEVDAWRAAAREVWPLPEPATVQARIRVEGPVVDAAVIEDVFRRETGAIAYCQEVAHQKAYEEYDPDDKDSQLAETSGRMEMSVVLNARGRVNGTYVEEKSKLQSDEIARCAAGRFRKLNFEPLLPPPPVPEGAERPPPPEATVWITYEFRKLPPPM